MELLVMILCAAAFVAGWYSGWRERGVADRKALHPAPAKKTRPF